ncbi:nucleotidyltransferase domain-containing protein [Massilia sp. S19_KUP03_FR1]|uniref:nucleotidyltransferase domain-containing protein n=1 Tax=Massilia sp. S19_KUP03_FR1 TaxID=3025503 RepID=UPI002FCDAFD1
MTPSLLLRTLRDPASALDLTLAQWDLMLRQAARAKLMACLVCLFDDAGLASSLPAPVLPHLEWTRVMLQRHAMAVDFEVERIHAALAGLHTPLLLLKGAAYRAAGLAPARGRLFSDVDILVPKARIGEVEAALMMHGWSGAEHDAYDQRYYREWMHEIPPMQHTRRQSVIDVHHAILPETARVRPDPARLRAAAVNVPGMPGVQTLAPFDMVLHSAVHLFYDGEFDNGLRDLFDLHRLLTQFGATPGFWDGLPARAFELELARPLLYALRYSARLLDTPVPAAAIAALAPAAPRRGLMMLMDGLFLRALQPAHASCNDALTGVARAALYVRGNWLRMPPLLLARHLFHKAFLSRSGASVS